jgi:sugar phosphate isomerase/epimerase
MSQPSDRLLPRREVFRRGGYCLGAALAGPGLAAAVAAAPAAAPEPFRYCLNTGTLIGYKLSLAEEVKVAAAAGYQAIELWLPKIQDFARQGGSLTDLKKRIADSGLSLESTIAFDEWIPETSERSPGGIEAWKRDLDLVAQLGGRRICASPLGANRPADCDLQKIAVRYGRLLKLGRTFGVTPQLELWGRATVLRRLGEVAYVLAEVGDPSGCAVLDVIHIYTGGSPLAGLRAFNGNSLHVFHLNDYPAEPPRERINDSFRVYPGDGVAPLGEILRSLRAIGFHGFLSLELFNQSYWHQPAGTVARVGLEKMRAVVARAING